jgi:hypothetical protein
MTGYVERYLAGEYQRVWQELWPRYWKEAQTEPFRSEALAVARAMMQRVRHNLETLVERAEALGYRFGYDWIEAEDEQEAAWAHRQPPVLSDPLPDLAERLQRLASQGILLPLSVQAWYEEVGAVNLVGTPPAKWDQRIIYQHDPLHPTDRSPQAGACTQLCVCRAQPPCRFGGRQLPAYGAGDRSPCA